MLKSGYRDRGCKSTDPWQHPPFSITTLIGLHGGPLQELVYSASTASQCVRLISIAGTNLKMLINISSFTEEPEFMNEQIESAAKRA